MKKLAIWLALELSITCFLRSLAVDMGRDKRNENKIDQFTKWIASEKSLPSWKALSFPARETYSHLRIRCYADAKGKAKNNNGQVFRSPRDLAKDMGCSPKVAMRAIADLQAKGWLVCTKLGELGSNGHGKTALFRFTMLPTQNEPATREPTNWKEGCDYEVIAYPTYKPKGYCGLTSNFKNKTPRPVWARACVQFGHTK